MTVETFMLLLAGGLCEGREHTFTFLTTNKRKHKYILTIILYEGREYTFTFLANKRKYKYVLAFRLYRGREYTVAPIGYGRREPRAKSLGGVKW